ncbi:hypothetical protein IFM89_036567 [Coptis chinensis]|uniref:Uncharacterized protein n=1 Tax=Coptis chinensis TaxID=261450 RepID=A0A835HJ41_9MAGN|nr:hypothetical protein IFM89_036567 [Coptis chinensis]
MPEVSIMSNNQAYGKKVCIEKVQEGSNCKSRDSGTLSGDTTTMQVHESINAHHVSNNTLPLKSKRLGLDASTPPPSLLSKHQQGVDPRVMQDHYSGFAMNTSGVPPSRREFMVSYIDPISGSMSSLHGKRENQDAPLTPSSKRARQTPVGLDGVQRQHLGSQLDSLSDISWNGPRLHLHADPREYIKMEHRGQKYPQKVLEAVPNRDASVSLFSFDRYGSRYGVKDELIKAENLDKTEIDRIRNDSNILEAENSHMDTRPSATIAKVTPNPPMRSQISQITMA